MRHLSAAGPLLLVLGVLATACERPTDPGPIPALETISLSHAAAPEWGPAVSVDPGGGSGLNTAALEGCPHESPSGLSLFFASNRDGQLDIWVVHRAGRGSGWGEPEKLPAPVNSAHNDFCPTPLPGGGLLFVSNRPGGCGVGSADMYQTRLRPAGGWTEPGHLGCEVNSPANEFSPSYVAAGGQMLFFSSDRAGQDDIYVAERSPEGGWGPASPVVELNAPGFNTARPNVSPDGREIVFDSNRPGGFGGPDIWTSTRRTVVHPWSEPVNVGPNVNSPFGETRASLSRDGKRLYFGSNRPDHQGNFDLFVSTRR